MEKGLHQVKEPKKYDFALILIVSLLLLCSLVAIYSSLKQLPAFQSGIVFTQIRWIFISCCVAGIILFFGNESLYDFIEIVYWILLALLVILFLNFFLKLSYSLFMLSKYFFPLSVPSSSIGYHIVTLSD